MSNFQKIDRNLWLMTGVASIPFAALAFVDIDLLSLPHLLYLFCFAVIFNGYIVPFLLIRGTISRIKRVFALGGNLLIAVLWINYTGGDKSIFYPAFFMLPIIAATMYGGFIDSLLAAITGSAVSLYFYYDRIRSIEALYSRPGLYVSFIFFFLIASVLGYLIKSEKEQQEKTNKMTSELEAAYSQLSASHEQLQGYTEIIQKMNREMEQLAITDELTNLYNYRYFQLTLDKELKKNKYSFLSMIMIDIDHFKHYNDAYGHAMGNKVLAELAKILKESVRVNDTVVRYGGEEFALILPACNIEEASRISEIVRKEVEIKKIHTIDGEETMITISVGIATFPTDAKNKSELISRADMALYKAKQTGRNKVCLYEEKTA